MSNTWERAQQQAYRDTSRQRDVKPLPKPRTITQVVAERMVERELEAIAPSTGYPDLDEIVKGFVPGHLYTLTGLENIGKTSLACNFADRVRRQSARVLYFALEPENTVVEYLTSVRLDKTFPEITTEDLQFDDGFIHVFGKQEVGNVQDLARIVRSIEDRYDLIIIDHIGYFVTNTQNTTQEQSNIVKQLAGLAKEKKTAIMLIAHLRKRPPGSKKHWVPTSDDISGSGSFKQDSTDVMIVTRRPLEEDTDNPRWSEEGILYVTKTKSGPNGQIPLVFSDRKANIMSVGEIVKNNLERHNLIPITKPSAGQDDFKW